MTAAQPKIPDQPLRQPRYLQVRRSRLAGRGDPYNPLTFRVPARKTRAWG